MFNRIEEGEAANMEVPFTETELKLISFAYLSIYIYIYILMKENLIVSENNYVISN